MDMPAFVSDHWSRLVDTCPLGLLLIRLENPDDDTTLRIVHANRAVEVHLGIAPDAVVGKRNEEVFPSLRERGFVDKLCRVARSGQGEAYEDIYYADDQISAAFAGRIEPVAEGLVASWFENVTQRRRTEAEAARAGALEEESRQRGDLLAQLEEAHMKAQEALDTYDLVARAADEALWEMNFEDPDVPLSPSSPCRFSDRFAELLGYGPEELAQEASTFGRITHPDDRAANTQAFIDLLRDPSMRMEIEYRGITKSGEVRHLFGTACMRLDGKGRPRKVAGAVRDVTRQKQSEAELRERLALIEQQRSLIEELSTPLLEVWDDVIALPIVGALDGRRAAITMQELLREISEKGVRFALVDLTGVETIDAATAEHVVRIAQAVALLGAQAIITGIQPPVAQTIVDLGLELSGLETRRNLRDGLRECIEKARRERARSKGRAPLTDNARRTGKPA
jgi:PAS domain S-box-containing protein